MHCNDERELDVSNEPDACYATDARDANVVRPRKPAPLALAPYVFDDRLLGRRAFGMSADDVV